jgi:hypothetical protein
MLKTIGLFRVPLIHHLLANYNVAYFTTYLIRRIRRRGISGIMNFVDNYSYWPTYCLRLSGHLFGIQTPIDLSIFSLLTYCCSLPHCSFPHRSFPCSSHSFSLSWLKRRNLRQQSLLKSPMQNLLILGAEKRTCTQKDHCC